MHLRPKCFSLRQSTPTRLACAAVVAAFVLGQVPAARAEFFQYSTTVTILNGYIPPASIVTNNSTTAATLTTPGGVGISLLGLASNSPGDNIDGTDTGSDIVFGGISVTGLTNTTQLENISIPYTFHIVLDDYPSFSALGALGSGTFDITGLLTGTVGKLNGGKQVNLTFNSYSPGNILTKFIGSEFYTFSPSTYVAPGPNNQGAFGAHVTARLVPEPSTVALLGMGAIGLATPAYRRLRRISRR